MERQRIKPITGELPRGHQFEEYKKWIARETFKIVNDYEVQGRWSPNPQTNIKMFKHKPTGCVLFEDHAMSRGLRLPIIDPELAKVIE